ncbi:hypothetical protein, partial [Pseudochryseolinea flava]
RENLSLAGCSSAEPCFCFGSTTQNSNQQTIFTTCSNSQPLSVGFSCNSKEKTFRYTVQKGQSGILIKDYVPVTKEHLTEYLVKVNDTLKMKTLNVFLTGENIQKINPEFKNKYYRGEFGKMDLNSFQNDTARAMRNLQLHFGALKGNEFVKNDDWDKYLLNNRFLRREEE